ncbi:polymorphic outer membrane protein middle domain-containing protein [Chlamydiifrater volucris]|uniref:polymorphic outer membrane protein middle domain-containing protein n=1 Tax=Chlamydiifrater volucris TaxID=2681470 RepID=UPI001BCE40B6|nr:polymorphic outer membrane protein middle domain-containing protein [Chlamydiifrater volucris]
MRNSVCSTIIAASSLSMAMCSHAFSSPITFDNIYYVDDPFSVRETSSTITKTLKRDFFSNASFETIYPSLSFLKSNKDLVLQGNHHSFVSQEIPVGISSSKGITFKNFSKIEFSEINLKDKLLSSPNITFANNDAFCFQNIRSLTGTIAHLNTSDALTISGNKNVVLTNNSSTKTGSVGQGGTLNIAGNKNFCAKGNSAGYGGAFHYKTIDIRNNDAISFSSNRSTGTLQEKKALSQNSKETVLSQYGGGAFSSATNATISGNNSVTFDNNTTATNGGAIYGKNLNISNNKSVSFTNNIGLTSGGAIYVVSSGNCFISGDSGNVRFQNNYGSNRTRNSIRVSRNSVLTLQAKNRYEIFLGDPLEVKENSTVTLNPNNKISPNLGKIVFSSEGDDLSETDRTSTIDSPTIQNDGIVYVCNNAILAPLTFSQTGGWLIIGATGTVTTLDKTETTPSSTKKNSVLNISKLGIDVSSILDNPVLGKGKSTDSVSIPQLIARSPTANEIQQRTQTSLSGEITISGPIYLTDADLLLYENNIRMASPIPEISLLQLGEGEKQQEQTTANGNINVSQVDLNTQPSHYGYQGVWHLAWDKSTLKGSWIPSGEYIVSPERSGAIIANSIWGNYAGIHSLLKVLHKNNYSSNGYPHNRTRWLHGASFFGVTNLFKPHPTNFKYKSAGGVARISSQSPQDVSCGIAVAKIRGNTVDENFSQKSKNDLLCGAALLEIIPWQNRYISIIKSSIAYGNSKERLESVFEYTLPSKESGNAEYRIHSLAGECFLYSPSIGYLPLPGIKLFPKIFPFVAVSAMGAKISGFKEQGSFPRNFSSLHHFLNISTPIGVQLHKIYSSPGHSLSCDANFSFSPDVYRKNPAVKGRLLFNNAVWEQEGEDLSWIGFEIDSSIKYKIQSWQMSANYSLHGRQSSMHHTANAGIQKIF